MLAWTLLLFAQVTAPNPPTAAEAIRGFLLPPGLRIELAASDPQIESPVAMAFGADGRLWVVEMRDYPNGPGPGEKPAGRIKILSDKDGDGVFESATVFADELLFANGVLPWKDGVIVTAAPHILWLRDTDGDGKADVRDVLFEGFATQNPQLHVSHPVLGVDGWVYVANGLRGGSIVSKKVKDAKPIPLAGMDFRFNPHTFEGEAISGMGQFGNTFDDFGNRFVCDNRNHLRHVVMPARYLKRNPHLAIPSPLEDVSGNDLGPLSSGTKVFPLSKNWTTSNLHAGRFTAACSVFVYRGDLLPFRGNAFTCDPTGNLVHREILTPHGATFRAKPAYDGKEFLATADDWFRPVFLSHGPDGAMYVVDMQRAIIEHPEWMPPELRKHPNLALGKERGRIWRIVPSDHKTTPVMTNLANATTIDLVKAIDSSDVWRRTTAQRLLLERRDKAALEPLRSLVFQSKNVPAQVQALWLIENLGGLDRGTLLYLPPAADARLVEHALIQSEAFDRSLVTSLLAKGASHADPRVRFQTALSLGPAGHPELGLLAKIAGRKDLDSWTRAAIVSSVADNAGSLLDLIPDAEPEMLRDLALIVGARQNAAETLGVLKLLPKLESDERRDAVVLGLAEGGARRGGRIDATSKEVAAVFERAKSRAFDSKTDDAKRIDAIRLLAHSAEHGKGLSALAHSNDSIAVKREAVQALNNAPREAFDGLIASWPSQGPAIRLEIANVLLSRPERVALLLDAVEANTIAARELDANTVRRLNQHPTLGARARGLLAAATPGDRKKVIERYREALTLKGDPLKGREVFKKSCAACHKIAGIGQITGPDISDTRTKTMEQLLIDVLDPNASIDANSVAYAIVTKSGKSLSGLIAAETASSVTLRRAEGQSDLVLRSDIEELRSTGRSLMPEGLEADVDVPRMADLLSFLKNWRYLD